MKFKDAKNGMRVVVTQSYAKKYASFFAVNGIEGKLEWASPLYGFVSLDKNDYFLPVPLRKLRRKK